MLTNPWLIDIAKETLLLRPYAILSIICSYSHQDSHSFPLHSSSQKSFCAEKTPVYQNIQMNISKVSVVCFSPVHFQGLKPRWVSCYAFFKGWRLLCLPPQCLRFKTPFDTLNMNFRTLTIVSLVRVSWLHLTRSHCFPLFSPYSFRVGKLSVGKTLCNTYPYFTP